MKFLLKKYSNVDATLWDSLIQSSWNGTFLHTRRYLGYHGNRFKDVSLLIEDASGAIAGVFPAAIDPDDPSVVVSHPGITYGGLVHGGSLKGSTNLEILQGIKEYYAEAGFHSLKYKEVPQIYHRVLSSDDSYSLYRLNAKRYRCDLTATIDLTTKTRSSERRIRGLKKAIKNGVKVASGVSYLEKFWSVLTENLILKHQVNPVHTISEIEYLASLFPENIECIVGLYKDTVIAGVVMYNSYPVAHVQYSAANQTGRELSGMDLVIQSSVAKARDTGYRYFDFGISTEQGGNFLNDSLHKFKLEFGSGNIVHDFYEVKLR